MALDPRTPILVGVGQVTQKAPPHEALEPVDLMAQAAVTAAGDAGSAALLEAVESVRVVSLLTRRYPNPGALVAERVGADPGHLGLTTNGGNSPQTLVNLTCDAIAAGQLDVALLCGGEAWRTRSALRRSGEDSGWTTQPEDTPRPEQLGEEMVMNAPGELARGIVMPVQLYPLFESALRAAAGRSLESHSVLISELWARFSAVAAGNPHAWITDAKSADEIRTAGVENRMVGLPYTKFMNSNNDVDQAAALLLCSVGTAEQLGIQRDRWVFPWAGTDAHDTPFVSNRVDLCSSPAMRVAGRRAIELAGVGVDDLAHIDLYSCFPSAVEIGAAELGLPLERQLTVTGGLSFAGGPWNNYAMHGIAAMADVLREDPGSVGLCSANGGYTTKHAFGVYSSEPPSQRWRSEHPQDEVDAAGSRASLDDHEGVATIEGFTVMHERDGEPATAIAACLTPDGARTWATSVEPGLLRAMTDEEFVGRRATVRAGGVLEV